jgi:hypothetical protein
LSTTIPSPGEERVRERWEGTDFYISLAELHHDLHTCNVPESNHPIDLYQENVVRLMKDQGKSVMRRLIPARMPTAIARYFSGVDFK